MSATVTTHATRWVRLGEVPPRSLTDARLQLHHAAQIAVSAAISYLPARADDSHTALSWSEVPRALTTEPITADRTFRIGVRLEDLSLIVLDEGERVTQEFALSGRTVGEAHAWLAAVAGAAGLDATRLTPRKHYTIPTHAVATGAPFTLGSGAEFRELQRYWSNAALALDEIARATDGASAVRCWPHHFDIAILIELPAARRSTIGVGQSPGDEFYAEPYWYVGPYPYPATTDLPSLGAVGRWHTSGWVGAALVASDLVDADAEGQRRKAMAFMEAAVAACRRLLLG